MQQGGFFNLIPSSTGPSAGAVYRCRESFATFFSNETKIVGYQCGTSHNPNLDSFRKFWAMIDEAVGISQEKIEETNHKNVIVIHVDPFWTINNVRRAFFTLLLRMGVEHFGPGKSETIDGCFTTYSLAASARNAVKHFLNGHTTPTFDTSKVSGAGIINHFAFFDNQPDELQKMLVRLVLNDKK